MSSNFFASVDLTPSLLAGILLFLLIVVYIHSVIAWKARSRGLPYPPGPQPLPIIGNLLDWPKTNQWATFRDISATYGEYILRQRSSHVFMLFCIGDVVYFRMLNQGMVILGSPEAIFEFLDKKSANTSDRLQSVLFDL